MNKEQKAAVVEELSRELGEADAILAVDYRGISVPQAAELRSGLSEAETRFRVVKNRLTLRAADAAGAEPLKEHLSGPTALALVRGDVALAAKTISRLGSEWELLTYKGGLMDGEELDPDSFQRIARLPGREALNGQFAGIVASPLTGLVRGLGSMVQGLASQLQQIADQGLVSGEAPAPETPDSDEAPAESEEPGEDGDAEPSEGGAGDEDESGDEARGAEASAEDEDSGEGEEESSPDDSGEQSAADPDPEGSPEETTAEEPAPGEEVPSEDVKPPEETSAPVGEGDAEIGSARDEEPAAGDTREQQEEPGDDAEEQQETSEDSDQEKEDQD